MGLITQFSCTSIRPKSLLFFRIGVLKVDGQPLCWSRQLLQLGAGRSFKVPQDGFEACLESSE